MYISDIDRRYLVRRFFGWGIASLFFLLFGIVYTAFGFGVTSWFMTYMFLIPLLFAALPYLIMFFCETVRKPSTLSSLLHAYGIITVTVGALLLGVLEIAGALSWTIPIFFVAGTLMIIISVLLYLLNHSRA